MSAFVRPSRRVLLLPTGDGTPELIDSRLSRGFDIVPTVYCEELWETPSRADLTSPTDRAPQTVAFPLPGQVIARMLEFRPATMTNVAMEQAAVDDLMANNGATRGDLHRTQTTDFFSVISGDVTLKADGDDVQLSAGDFAVCLGALHGWSCHTSGSARVFAVLAGAQDYGDENSKRVQFAESGRDDRRHVRRVILGHDSLGQSRILDDQLVTPPARLWSTGGPIPSNSVEEDSFSDHEADLRTLSNAQGFEAVLVNSRHPSRVRSSGHQLIGVVVRGEVDLVADGVATRAPLSAGEMFVSNGFDVSIVGRTEDTALVSFVSLPGGQG